MIWNVSAMRSDTVSILACPICKKPLRFDGEIAGERIVYGQLECRDCDRSYQVIHEIPFLKIEELSAGEWSWELSITDEKKFEELDVKYTESLPREARIASREIKEAIAEYACRFNGPIVDIATGRGSFLRDLATRVHDKLLLGTDVDLNVLLGTQRAMKKANIYSQTSLVVSDAKNLAFTDKCTDIVTSYFGYQNIPDAHKALKETHRILKKNGSLIFSTMLLKEDSKSFAEAERRGYRELFCEKELKLTLENAGFRLTSTKEFVSGTWPGNPYDLLPFKGEWYAHVLVVAAKE